MMTEEHHINKKRKVEVILNNKESAHKIIKLYCPAVSKLAEILAWEDQRLDLGSIARTFGLEPATLRINGHFISRGVDLIASSVTWRSLLSFFSSKGLSTGTHSSAALVVDGRLSRCGTKRCHEPEAAQPEFDKSKVDEDLGLNEANRHEEGDSRNMKKMKEISNACEFDRQTINSSNIGLKRKLLGAQYCPWIKKVKTNEICSNQISKGHEETNCGFTKLGCGYQMHDSMKRLRENDSLEASSYKRTRLTYS